MAIVEVNCSICDKPALLTLCRVDEHGRPAHEQCLADTLASKPDLSLPVPSRWTDGAVAARP
jgi:hypothetical protein